MRRLALIANVGYVVGLLVAAYNIYVWGHRPASGPLADWAGFDAGMMSLLAAATVLFAAVHLVALRAWWRGGGLSRN